MREILFRGIPKCDTTRHFFADIWKDNCEGSFVYGSLIISKDRYYICVSALCKINSCINNGVTSMIEVIPETIGQYTGLTDKNGKKIFEGDIVKQYCNEDGSITDIGKVYWNQGTCCYLRTSCDIDVEYYQMWESSTYEVIGNIHDNPELLKGDTK